MEIIKNDKGGEKLCYGGFMYTKKVTKATTIRWECSQRKAKNCKGALTTSVQKDNVCETVAHSHAANPAAVDAAKAKIKMRELIEATKSRPAQVLATAMLASTSEARVELGNAESMKRNLRRQKRAILPPDPATLDDLIISDKWTMTGGTNPQPFLIHDSGTGNNDRLIVFASPEQLRHLALADTWFMDGTFSVSPRLFTQLYVIRAPMGESAVTCVYAFMTGKQQDLYERFLRVVVDKANETNTSADPKRIICDFESAVINAVAVVLGPHVAVQGCFYHLCQSTWRKLQELGLATEYKSNESLRHFCGMLDGLALLPVTDVAAGMQFLIENVPDIPRLDELIEYFDTTYVSGTARSITRQTQRPVLRLRRTPPLFPPEKWNVHEATLTDGVRTNNECEGWNNGFRQLVGHYKPSVWVAIEALQMDEALSTTALIRHARGEPSAKRIRRETVQLQRRLSTLCRRRHNGDITVEECLRGVGHTVRLCDY